LFSARFERKHPKDYSRMLSDIAPRFLEEAGTAVEGQAKLLLREKGAVDTGNLMGSITHRVMRRLVEIGTNVAYAIWVEYGTRFMRGRSYLREAIDRLRKRLVGRFQTLVKEWVRHGRA
jgi:phage gpG-like protein